MSLVLIEDRKKFFSSMGLNGGSADCRGQHDGTLGSSGWSVEARTAEGQLRHPPGELSHPPGQLSHPPGQLCHMASDSEVISALKVQETRA